MVEDEILAFMIKPTIEKLMDFVRECKVQDNLELYHEIRQLICYLKEEHIQLFRKVLLTPLIVSSQKRKGSFSTQTFKIVKYVQFGTFLILISC